MKPVLNFDNDSREENSEEQCFSSKKLQALINANREREEIISELEKDVETLAEEDKQLDAELELYRKEFESLNSLKGESAKSEPYNEMEAWIQTVQKYNGLPQQAIDSLVSVEYEAGPEQQICLGCYVQLKAGVQCKYLPCCHLLHAGCADSHLKISKLCPACQEEVIV